MPSPKESIPGVPDWSTLHEPGGDALYPTLKQHDPRWRDYKLSNETVQSFWRDGFITNVPILTPEQCDEVLKDCQYLLVSNIDLF